MLRLVSEKNFKLAVHLFKVDTVRIHRDLENFDAQNPVLTIGTFDGVHLGHRKVISHLKDFAKKHNGESVVFTFYPHPRLVTSPDETNLRLLTTLEEKQQLFEKSGIDHLIIFPFTKEFSKLTYTEFVKTVLVDQIKTHCLVVGYDHKFGKDRKGGFEYLKKCADEYGFHIEQLDVLSINDLNVSSTKIRAALQKGKIKTANKYLGYEFLLHGRVVTGQKVGRTIGFPTANVEASDVHKLIPGYGVYAVRLLLNGEKLNGMLNIGTRPTFNQNADNRSIEVNIFDFEGDIYNKEITLVFVDKIRDEKRFPEVNDLIEQLKKDEVVAQKILADE